MEGRIKPSLCPSAPPVTRLEAQSKAWTYGPNGCSASRWRWDLKATVAMARRKDGGQFRAQEADTLAHRDPAFQHEGANLVDDAGALRHQPLAHPMQCLHIQLLRGLGRHELHRRALHGFGNRFGIIE